MYLVEAPALYLLPLSKRARCRKSLTAAHAGAVGAPLSFLGLRCCIDEVSTLGFQVSSSPTPPAPTVFASPSPLSTWDDAQSSVQERSPTESQPARLSLCPVRLHVSNCVLDRNHPLCRGQTAPCKLLRLFSGSCFQGAVSCMQGAWGGSAGRRGGAP